MQKNYWIIILVSTLILSLLLLIIAPYQRMYVGSDSIKLAPLKVFLFNQSSHHDPVKQCWYDSGDYVVFIQRNALTLYYLSLAYSHAQLASTQEELLKIIDTQYDCIKEMVEDNYKQFRDQDSHGSLIPPIIHSFFYPQTSYTFQSNEGEDVAFLMYLVSRQIGRQDDLNYWQNQIDVRSSRTFSEHCCEEGVVKIHDAEYQALVQIFNHNETQAKSGWGISPRSLLLLQNHELKAIKDILTTVRRDWEVSPSKFWYIGGNYDIAGTIALERWYAKISGDNSFKGLSDNMYSYLHGENSYEVNFSNYSAMHHPCGTWWSNCDISETLINGVDEAGVFDPNRNDNWRLTEVQLVGQAQYLLAYILYHNL